ncbi:hypothetical protein ACHAPJ_011932 [Fusarium lateritium]
MTISDEPPPDIPCDCGEILTTFHNAEPEQRVCNQCFRSNTASDVAGAEAKLLAGNQAIYTAFKDSKALKKSVKWGSKKASTVIAKRQDRQDVRDFIEEHGIEDLRVRVKELVNSGVFVHEYIARRMFPDLYRDKPSIEPACETAVEPVAEHQNPTEIDFSAWIPESEVARPAAFEEAAPTEEDVPAAEYTPPAEPIPAEEPVLAEETILERNPTSADDTPPAEEASQSMECVAAEPEVSNQEIALMIKAIHPRSPDNHEESQACQNKVPKEDRIHLPFTSQHELIVHLQRCLESVCFAYGRENIPTTLQERGWSCSEEVQLSVWMDELLLRQHEFDTNPGTIDDLDELFRSVAKIQYTAVHRLPIDPSGIKKLVVDATRLVKVLQVEPFRDIVENLQLGMEKVIDDLIKEEHKIQQSHEEKLADIALKRLMLDELERSTCAETKRSLNWCESSAGLRTTRIVDEAEKSFKTERFFVRMGYSTSQDYGTG